jgi:prepilin peptidase CpaA
MTSFALLTLMLLLAVRHDIRSRRIPNLLVGAGMLAGLACAAAPGGMGLPWALAGMGLGLVCLLPLYALGALGAGDVKLMAAVGGLIGPHGMPLALLWTLLAGGLLTLLVTLYHGTAMQMLRNVRDMLTCALWRLACREMPRLEPAGLSAGKMPYAIAIACGAWMQQVLPGAGLISWQ